MSVVGDYVARIEETCGEEKHYIVLFKYDRKEEAIAKILKKAKMSKSVLNLVFILSFNNVSFRLYRSGKAIFQNMKEREELEKVLANLLS